MICSCIDIAFSLIFWRVLNTADRYAFIDTWSATIYLGSIIIQLPHPGVITSDRGGPEPCRGSNTHEIAGTITPSMSDHQYLQESIYCDQYQLLEVLKYQVSKKFTKTCIEISWVAESYPVGDFGKRKSPIAYKLTTYRFIDLKTV
jgi:hypothetical protein